jgi:hypothetical protein
MATRNAPLGRSLLCGGWLVLVVAIAVGRSSPVSAQSAFPRGQNIAPVYEGWEKNADGSFNLVFGYFNRNWEEEIDLPIGPDNSLSLDLPDQGQPTHFLPRRNRFVFRVRVPKDFGKNEVVWTLTSHGKTERAYATLKPDYFIDDIVIMNNLGGAGAAGGGNDTLGNKAPVLKVEGEGTRRTRAGQPMAMTAFVTDDDGKPRRVAMPPVTSRARQGGGNGGTPNSATGLRLSWFVYRGPGKVTFDPPQIEVWEDHRDGANSPWAAGFTTPPTPAGGKWEIRATFSVPGTYVLRCLASDGALLSSEDVTFVVE